MGEKIVILVLVMQFISGHGLREVIYAMERLAAIWKRPDEGMGEG